MKFLLGKRKARAVYEDNAGLFVQHCGEPLCKNETLEPFFLLFGVFTGRRLWSGMKIAKTRRPYVGRILKNQTFASSTDS